MPLVEFNLRLYATRLHLFAFERQGLKTKVCFYRKDCKWRDILSNSIHNNMLFV